MTEQTEAFDYIVVGAGSAGCAVANRLSADPRNKVLLLEAGGRDLNPWIHVPVGYFKTIHNPSVDWCYETQPDAGLNGRSIKWPRGKVLGGSSSINGLLYVRGQAEDFNHWRQLGNVGWAYDDVLPYFMKAEDQERGSDDYHGEGGPLKVSNIRGKRDICEAFISACEEVGIPRTDDFNGENQEGVSYFQQTAHKGRRCSSAVAYLKPARGRKNLKIETKALVKKVAFTGNRASGVSYNKSGKDKLALAKAEIVLCSGAINSPQLLNLSGIGDGSQLTKLGIPVLSDLLGVGKNLQDHLQIRAVYKISTNSSLNTQTGKLWQNALIGAEYALFRTGALTIAASQVGVFAKTHPSLETPDIQFHMQPLSSDSPGEGLHPFGAFTSSVCQLRPESRGHIETVSADPTVYPEIHPNYLATPLDQETAVAGMKLSRQLSETAALQPHVTDEYDPGHHIQTDEEFLEHARNTAQTIYHPTSTCKMGPDSDKGAVVDARLRVYGVEGLRVADASIMPTITSGNTNAPAIMIGEKVADMMLQDAKASLT